MRHALGVAVVCLFAGGCSEPSSPAATTQNDTVQGSTAEPALSLVAFDPFPADIDLYECTRWLADSVDSEHGRTLAALLKVRPHRVWTPVVAETLAAIDPELVHESRRDRLIYRVLLHPEVMASLDRMIKAAARDDIALRVRSGYRSPSYQNALWKRSVREHESDLASAAFMVAPPCYSEHATGRSIDLTLEGPGYIAYRSDAHNWLRANAARFGWRQSFRRATGAVGSSSEPGISLEPWHYHHESLTWPETALSPHTAR